MGGRRNAKKLSPSVSVDGTDGMGLKLIDELRFDVHGDGSDNPAQEKYAHGLGLFLTTLEPKQGENNGHNDGHRDPPTYKWIHNDIS
jgi:hypothetical protein